MKTKSILNKILSIILSTVICSSAVLTGVSAASNGHDIDADGVFDINDSTYLQMYLAGYFELSESAFKTADADHSLAVDIGDVTRIQMLLAGYTFEESTTKPTTQPTTQKPTVKPTTQPTTQKPTVQPTTQPTTQKPTVQPTTQPTTQKPTVQPTTQPTTQKPTVQPTTQPTEDFDKYADEVIRLANIERAKVGAEPLRKNDTLTEIAKTRSVEISQQFSHLRPNGEYFHLLCIEKGLSFSYIGENLGKGQKTPEKAIKDWMTSKSHKDVLLDSRYTDTGVACYKDGNTLYWVQLFLR